ncbi:MAG: Tol-Pal system protein TolB [Parachlamydiaceae bacterium]|nr:Tol-Pal system protein TolB [Parachlamydiaceae bacterium]
MKTLFTLFFIAVTFSCFAKPQESNDEIVIRLETEVQLIALNVTDFVNQSDLPKTYIQQLNEVLRFDLNHNGMTYVTSKPADAFYTISVTLTSGNKLSATMVSANNGSKKSVDGLALTGTLSKDRRLIHQLADALHEALFDKEGIASTQILYAIKKQTGEKWISEIWEADYDGENARPIIKDNSYSITPIYVPAKPGHKSGSFFYVSYKAAQPKIYIASLQDGISKRFIAMSGNQLMPAISQQRDKVAFICDVTSNPDLFIQAFNPESGVIGKPQQIFTAQHASQGSPTFNPEGTQIAFVSNKDGSPRIYVIDIPSPGTSLKDVKARLVTKHSKESSAPTWSPDGSKLAYCAMTDGTRQIWIYNFNTKEERQLTRGPGNKENPSWAPNSLSLVYNSSDPGSSDLYLINLNQPKATKITSGPGEKRFPSWLGGSAP